MLYMLRIIHVISFILASFAIFSQEETQQINCIPITPSGCNYITNISFTPSPQYNPSINWGDPFRNQPNSLIPDWLSSHGSPNVYDGINYPNPLPFANSGYSRMAAGNVLGDPANEGIIQKITPLEAGKEYGLSFFKKKDNFTPISYAVDNFYIVLMHCSSYAEFDPSTSEIPAIPVNSQVIYNETSFGNTNWDQVFKCFRANDNYDMIWFFPKQNRNNNNLGVALLSYPELINISNFSAGLSPIPTAPNCTVTIGPNTPNCSVKNAVYTWHGPSGQVITAPPNQQIQVDANDFLNVGIWTLVMTVPGVVNSASLCNIRSTVNLPDCRISFWPKVYYSDKYPQLFKGQNGNIFFDTRIMDINPNLNHVGVYPQPPFNNAFSIQYNTTSGISNWINSDQEIAFVFNSGDLQVANSIGGLNYQYINGGTGLSITPPINIPSGHEIVAEKSSNEFIAVHKYVTGLSTHTDLYLHTSAGSSPPFNLDWVKAVKYNPITKKLFVIVTLPLPGYPPALTVFDLSNNTFDIDANTNPYIPLNYYDRFVQVDNSDNVYVVHNGILQIFDYNTGGYIPINIQGFTNNNLIAFYSNSYPSMNGSYTDNKCLVGQMSEEKIYFLDFGSLAQRNISTNNFLNSPNSTWASTTTDYIINGNTVFIAGSIFGNTQNSVGIGSQQINFLGVGNFSNYLAQFDLTTGFGARFYESQNNNEIVGHNLFDLALFPNPASNFIKVIIENKMTSKSATTYALSIFDHMNNLVVKNDKYQSGADINIFGLKKGVYYIEIISNWGVKKGKTFIKM